MNNTREVQIIQSIESIQTRFILCCFAHINLKCDVQDQALYNYVLYVINYLSDSLILFVNIFFEIYPILLQLPKELIKAVIKILIKRIRIFTENNVLCCEYTKDSDAIVRIKALVQRLINDGLVNLHDLNFLQDKGVVKPEVIELYYIWY